MSKIIEDVYHSDIALRPDVFPVVWDCDQLSSEEVDEIIDGINPSSHLLSKSRLNGDYWKQSSLKALIESYHERWNFRDDLVICVWDVCQQESEPPLGFVAFDILWDETKTKKVASITLTLNL